MTINQTIRHLVNILNGEARREEIRKLEQEIEQVTLQTELNQFNDSYVHRLNHLSALQYRHLDLVGKYHPYGVYAKIRRRE